MLENIFQLYSNMKWKKEMYLYLNVVVYLNNLFRLFARQPLLPLLVKILKEKKIKSSRTPSHQGYKRFVWKATLSSCNNWHRFRRCFFPFLFSRSQHVLYTLMEKLDKMISQQFLAIWKNDFQSNPSETNATAIADGMFILNYSNRNLPKTNPALVRRVLVKFLNVTKICKDPCFEMYDISSKKMLNGNIMETLKLREDSV